MVDVGGFGRMGQWPQISKNFIQKKICCKNCTLNTLQKVA
jgi:hypothetical protein